MVGKAKQAAETNPGPACSLCLLPRRYNLPPLKSFTVHEIALLAVNGQCWLVSEIVFQRENFAWKTWISVNTLHSYL